MPLRRRLSVLSSSLFICFSLAACQTAQDLGIPSDWWGVPTQKVDQPVPAPTPSEDQSRVAIAQPVAQPAFDPTALPRTGAEIQPWDPTRPTVQQPDAEVKAEEWTAQFNPRSVTQPARVGVLLPLSGQVQDVGQDILNAAQLALFDFAGTQYELLPYDTQSTPEGAVQAARYAIADGVSLIIGPLLSQSARAIQPYLEAANVTALALTNDSAAASSHLFVTGVRPEEEVDRVIQFAAQNGSQRYALLAPADEYGIRVRSAFDAAVQREGGSVSQVMQFLSGSDDIASMVRTLADYDARRSELLRQRTELEAKNDAVSQRALDRLKVLQTLGDVDFDTLLVAAGGETLQTIAANLPYYDIDPKKVRILGTSLWQAQWVRGEPALRGGWFAAPSTTNTREFSTQYRALYGKAPNRVATLAYDTVALSAVLANDEGTADYSRATLTDPAGYLGRNGIFRLNQAGVAERGLSVMEVRSTALREISAAPNSFLSSTQ